MGLGSASIDVRRAVRRLLSCELVRGSSCKPLQVSDLWPSVRRGWRWLQSYVGGPEGHYNLKFSHGEQKRYQGFGRRMHDSELIVVVANRESNRQKKRRQPCILSMANSRRESPSYCRSICSYMRGAYWRWLGVNGEKKTILSYQGIRVSGWQGGRCGRVVGRACGRVRTKEK